MPRACLASSAVLRSAHSRNLLDPVPPEQLAAPFWQVFEHLRAGDYLEVYQGHSGAVVVRFRWHAVLRLARKIDRAQCSTRVVNGRTYYWRSLVAPLLVAPGENRVIALEPEFIRPQDALRKARL